MNPRVSQGSARGYPTGPMVIGVVRERAPLGRGRSPLLFVIGLEVDVMAEQLEREDERDREDIAEGCDDG